MAPHDDTLLPPVRDFESDDRESVRNLDVLASGNLLESMVAQRRGQMRSSTPRISLRREAAPSSFDDGFHKVR